LVRVDTKRQLARSLIGMVVRARAAKPDISSVEALRKTLLAAEAIAYSDSGSGTYLSTILFPKLGIADQIAGKSRKVRGPNRATIFLNPAVVNGEPRSLVNTNRLTRGSARSARISSP
jgi:hypothetical protein